jgi:hypothetical protein
LPPALNPTNGGAEAHRQRQKSHREEQRIECDVPRDCQDPTARLPSGGAISALAPPSSLSFDIVIGYLHSHNTGLALLDAEWDFRRARRAYLVARIGGWMLRRRSCRHPRALSRSTTLAAGPSRLEVVPLRAIVGTLQPTDSFDSDFRPASDAVRGRWARIALAHRKGDALPPVVLHRQPDGYYVVDGRHRVSVARALQHRDIDAWVTGPRR